MIRKAIAMFGFLMTLMLACMAFILICSINLVLNGYHRECGSTPEERVWRNAVPFMCSLNEETVRATPRRPSLPQRAQKPKPPPRAARAGRPSRCAPLQQEPYRVQCDPGTGFCYHDLGYRANCGLADNWDGRE